ncbi:MAG: hypothetical protein ACREJB_18905 [Planctomycetaceae bacterium]
MSSFSCPHCSTVLRIRERSLVGQQVECPECHGLIVIVGDGPRGFTAQRPRASAPRPVGHENVASLSGKLLSPLGIGWAIAGTVAAALFAVVFWPDSDQQKAAEPAGRRDRPAHVEPVVKHKTLRPSMPEDSQPDRADSVLAEQNHDESPKSGPTRPGSVANEFSPGEIPPEGSASLPAEQPESPSVTAAQHPPPLFALRTPHSEFRTSNPELPDPPADLPADPEAVLLAPQPPSLTKDDNAAALAQPIARFEQARPVAARVLLFEIEEMAGVPIDIDPAVATSGSPLDRPVTLRLEQVTVAEILEEMLRQLGLSYEVRDHAAVVVP